MVLIQKIVHIHEIDNLHTDSLVLDRLQFHVIDVKILVLGIVIVLENSIPIEVHHVHDTLSFVTNQKTLDLLTIFLPLKNCDRSFSDLTPEIESTLEFIFLHIGHPEDHLLDMRLQVEELLISPIQTLLIFMAITLKTVQCQQTNLTLICIPLK